MTNMHDFTNEIKTVLTKVFGDRFDGIIEKTDDKISYYFRLNTEAKDYIYNTFCLEIYEDDYDTSFEFCRIDDHIALGYAIGAIWEESDAIYYIESVVKPLKKTL